MRLLMRWTKCTRKIVLFGGYALLAGLGHGSKRLDLTVNLADKINKMLVFCSSERMSFARPVCLCDYVFLFPYSPLTLRSYLWRARLQIWGGCALGRAWGGRDLPLSSVYYFSHEQDQAIRGEEVRDHMRTPWIPICPAQSIILCPYYPS